MIRSAGQRSNNWETLRHDLMASFVVFLVALPLCLGIALASGAPPAAGLITGVIGGAVVGVISGAPFQVSGPAAGMIVILAQLIANHGIAAIGPAVAFAGIVQIVAWRLRLGQWFRAVSPAVVEGMLAGIGVLILLSQLHLLVDHKPRKDALSNFLALPELAQSVIEGEASSRPAATIGLLTFGLLLCWPWLAPRRWQLVPAPLAAVSFGALLAAAGGLQVNFVQVPDNLVTALNTIALPAPHALWDAAILPGMVIAVVASAETLLCATATDQLHHGPRAKYDQELLAQGVGNLVCGILGGLPMTGVIVRSAANVKAGARSRAATILHGVWLLVIVMACPGLLRRIPNAALAALLVYTGIKLINLKAVRMLWRYSRSEALIYVATLAVVVGKDLLTGVLVGVGLSLAKLAYTFSRLEIRVDDDPRDSRVHIDLEGSATFLRLPDLAAAFDRIRPAAEVHVSFAHLEFIDHACLDLLMNWAKRYESTRGRLVIDWHSLHARFRSDPASRRRRPQPQHRPQLNLAPTATYVVGMDEHQPASRIDGSIPAHLQM